jgi:acetoin utilization deacetylase AcuC-like enzyme
MKEVFTVHFTMDLLSRVRNWWERVKEEYRPYLEEKKIIKEHDKDLDEEIERARQQWIEAHNYFESVSDPELIDHASYLIQAAETKYMYLLNKAKE